VGIVRAENRRDFQSGQPASLRPRVRIGFPGK
jgi:hypothetical protein